jgi:hypothetical protein
MVRTKGWIQTWWPCEAWLQHLFSIINDWLVVWNMAFFFSIIYGIILPIDFHIFQDG